MGKFAVGVHLHLDDSRAVASASVWEEVEDDGHAVVILIVLSDGFKLMNACAISR